MVWLFMSLLGRDFGCSVIVCVVKICVNNVFDWLIKYIKYDMVYYE